MRDRAVRRNEWSRAIRMRQWGWAAGVALLVVGGCRREERTLGDALRDLPQDTAPVVQPDVIPPAEALAVDTTPPLGTSPPGTAAPGEPQDVVPWIPEEEQQIPANPATPPNPTTPAAQGAPPGRDWTAGATRRGGAQAVATVAQVRTAPNPGFDRVVFEFSGGRIPGYRIEYVDRPIRECGSGRVVPMSGQGWLRVRLEPARMHTDAGTATVTERHRQPELDVLREIRTTCDFEAQVEWVFAVRSPNRYRVLELTEPARLVVDIQHDG
jgi:hypothetical protein